MGYDTGHSPQGEGESVPGAGSKRDSGKSLSSIGHSDETVEVLQEKVAALEAEKSSQAKQLAQMQEMMDAMQKKIQQLEGRVNTSPTPTRLGSGSPSWRAAAGVGRGSPGPYVSVRRGRGGCSGTAVSERSLPPSVPSQSPERSSDGRAVTAAGYYCTDIFGRGGRRTPMGLQQDASSQTDGGPSA